MDHRVPKDDVKGFRSGRAVLLLVAFSIQHDGSYLREELFAIYGS